MPLGGCLFNRAVVCRPIGYGQRFKRKAVGGLPYGTDQCGGLDKQHNRGCTLHSSATLDLSAPKAIESATSADDKTAYQFEIG